MIGVLDWVTIYVSSVVVVVVVVIGGGGVGKFGLGVIWERVVIIGLLLCE